MLGATIAVMALTLAHPSATRQFTWPWILLVQTMWLAPIVALAADRLARPGWHLPERGLLAGLLGLAAAVVAAAALSPLAAHSLPCVWPTLGGVAALLWLHDRLAADGADERTLAGLTRGLGWAGAILAAASAGGWLAGNRGFAWEVRNAFPFGHSIQTAGAMLLVLPWLALAAWSARGAARVFRIAALLAGLLALFATGSRSAAVIVGLLALAGASRGLFRARLSGRAKIAAVLAALAVAVLAVLVNPRLRELAGRGAWSDLARESNTQRRAMIEAGLLLGRERPLIGWGPGTVSLVYPRVRARLDAGVDNVAQLHNTPVQLWATLGLLGALPALLLAGVLGRRLVQVLRTPSPPAHDLAAAASLAGYGLFSLTDHQLDLPAFNALVAVNAAILLFRSATATRAWAPARGWRIGFVAVASAGLLAALWPAARDLAARYRYEQYLILLGNGRTTAAMERLAQAIRLAPHDPYYRHQLAAQKLSARALTDNPADRASLLTEATAILAASTTSGVLAEYARFNLGWLALEADRPAAAIQHFRAALQEAPTRRGACFGLGLACRAMGAAHEAAAVRAFALEWLNDPAAATAPLWEWPDFAPLRPAVEAEALRLLSVIAADRPAAGYLRELWLWWWQAAAPPARGWNRESAAFVRCLAALRAGAPPPSEAATYPWGALLRAWRSPDPAAALAALTPGRPALGAALARRAARHPAPDLHGFLCSGLENEAALLATERPARTGYGVLARHPDGPVLTDLYVRQQHRLVSEFASPLFPPKGWIPAARLLEHLPAAP
ncbi:MAG: O-antigen ligase family protein [Verrucomicrobiota bacterium]